MIDSEYEIVSGVTGNTLNITKNTGGNYDELAQKMLRSDCPYFSAPVTQVTINGETIFRYDIGSFSAMADMNMKMSGAEFMKLLKNLITPLTDCCDWMLDSHQFIMLPEMVFVSRYDCKVRYIYSFDLNQRSSDDDITGFFSEIIKKVRITDSTELSNDLLRMVVDNNVTVASLLDMVNRYSESNYRNNAENIAFAQKNVRIEKPAAERARDIHDGEAFKKESLKKDISNSEKKMPGIVQNLAIKPESKEEKLNISDELFSHERDETMEKLFGSGNKKPEKKSGRKNDKKPSAKENGMDLLLKFFKKDKLQPAAEIDDPLLTGKDIFNNDETFFAGADSETEFAGKCPYFVLKEKKGELNAPIRIDIFLDNNDEMYIGRQCDEPKHSGYKFDPEFKKISRTHAKISYDGMDYYITDLDSANKTLLNGSPITPNTAYLLNEGTIICFGDSLYLYEFRLQ